MPQPQLGPHQWLKKIKKSKIAKKGGKVRYTGRQVEYPTKIPIFFLEAPIYPEAPGRHGAVPSCGKPTSSDVGEDQDCSTLLSGPYLLRLAQEAAWREDNRRLSNGEQVSRFGGLACGAGRPWISTAIGNGNFLCPGLRHSWPKSQALQEHDTDAEPLAGSSQ